MDNFKTQFMMSEVRTYVTVDRLEDDKFGCTLNLVGFFDGDEIPTSTGNYDLTIRKLKNGEWEPAGPMKVHLKPDDLHRLGKAIEEVQQ
jgi:hypothetical protein